MLKTVTFLLCIPVLGFQRILWRSLNLPEIRSGIHFCYLWKLSRDDCITLINEAHGPGMIWLPTVLDCILPLLLAKSPLITAIGPGPVYASNSRHG
jgi:hypothetical protein